MRERLIRKLLVLLVAIGLPAMAFFAEAGTVTGVASSPCTTVYLNSAPLQTANPGQLVTLTATSTGCLSPEFQFYLQPPGGSWAAQGGFSPSADFAWDTTGAAAGIWGVGVWARESGTTVAYDVYALATYNLWVNHCTALAFSAAPLSPTPPGTLITFTVTGIAGCGTPNYRFLALPPGGTWGELRAYGASNSFAWDTRGLAPGTWQIGVWIREFDSTASYDAYGLATYALLPIPPCTFVIDFPNPGPPSAPGTTVLFTPSSSCRTLPEYEFWRLAPGGTWTIVQPYGVGTTFTWNTTGFATGRYQIGVWVRQTGSTNAYESYQILTYDIGT